MVISIKEVAVVPNYLQRTWVEIHLDRLRNNAAVIRKHLADGCRFMAVIKADAYGHGAVQTAATLAAAGVDWFGVSNLDEAIELRRAGIHQPILIISYTPATEVARLVEYDVTQTVVSIRHARELSAAADAASVTLRVHFKLDTGMSRIGFPCLSDEDRRQTIQEIETSSALPGLMAEGIFTHFASSDEQDDDGFTQRQFARFTEVIECLEGRGVHFSLRHCCNSAAILRFPHMHLDMVRAGLILYGLKPEDWMEDYLSSMQPIMEFKTTVSMVKEVQTGTPIGYGRTYSTPSSKRIATVSIGYADGYPRRLSGKAIMVINGERVAQVGRICMDQCMLDVTAMPSVDEGTVVTVFGEGVPVEELADIVGTNNYEMVCMINRRVPRVYYDGEVPVAVVNHLL